MANSALATQGIIDGDKGDVTISSSGTVYSLDTVNSNVGSFTNANITVNAKGLITAASTGSGGSGNVTAGGTLTNNALVIGQGTTAVATTTTGTGVLTALGINVGSAGAFLLNNGAGTSLTGIPYSLTGTANQITLSAATGNITFSLPNDLRITSASVGTNADSIATLSSTSTFTNKTLTSPTLTTPVLGTPSSGTLTNCTGLPAASVVAGTFGTGAYTMDTRLTVPQILNTPATISVSSNAGTVTRANRINNFTNSSAATMTITMSTTSAVDGDMVMVVILDSSAAAQTITWVNTENSTVTAPTTSNGSTTLPLTVGFKWNNSTSKWRCVAKS